MHRSITCVGIATLDRVWFVETLPALASKVRSRNYLEIGGGQAANAAVTIARLGSASRIVSVVGGDAAGRTIRDQLRDEGVEISHLVMAQGARSVTAAVLVDARGERTIIADVDQNLRLAFTSVDAAALAGTDVLLVDVKHPDASYSALGAAKRLGIVSVIDVEPTTQGQTERLSPLADHVIFGQAGLADFTRCDDPSRGLQIASERLTGVVGVTLGARGALIMTPNGEQHVAAPIVDAVDTTGAGDAFHGAYALAISEGRPPVAAARFANVVAALKCTRPGGRAGLPSRRDVEYLLKGSDV